MDKQNDFIQTFSLLKSKKKTFFIVWGVTFVLSCVWIFPQPRTYTCVTTIAPESTEKSMSGSLASIASSIGMDIESNGEDAIYPELYPALFQSTRFLSELCDIQIKTKDGGVKTDYFDYLKNHQKKNVLFYPFAWIGQQVGSLFSKHEAAPKAANGKRFDPFYLDKETSEIFMLIEQNIQCSYSQSTDIVTITVNDQDPLVSALMADSVKIHLQDYITEYRTHKARIDYEHYKKICAQARAEYIKAASAYASYCDGYRNATSDIIQTRKKELESEMLQKNTVYTAASNRLEAAQAKVQEVTPAFTTIKNSTVPYKASAPKRSLFVLIMLFLSTFGTAAWIMRKDLLKWF